MRGYLKALCPHKLHNKEIDMFYMKQKNKSNLKTNPHVLLTALLSSANNIILLFRFPLLLLLFYRVCMISSRLCTI